MTATAADILRLAQERIARPQDWRKNAEGMAYGANCLVGAIRYASESLDAYQGAAYYEAHELLQDGVVTWRANTDSDSVSVGWFNDRYTTTHADALMLLDCALDAVEYESD